jgi:hypothetical protein
VSLILASDKLKKINNFPGDADTGNGSFTGITGTGGVCIASIVKTDKA